MKKQSKVFLVWEANETEIDPEPGYWNQYESIEDAVSDKGDGVDIYVAQPQYLGKFEKHVEMVKIPSAKKRVAKKGKK